jgi:hypothetical protein
MPGAVGHIAEVVIDDDEKPEFEAVSTGIDLLCY